MRDGKPNLWKHQLDALERMESVNHLGLFFECGTGKTLTAWTIIERRCFREKKVLKTLILAPNIVTNNWLSEGRRFVSEQISRATCVIHGSADKRRKILRDRKDCRIFVTNHDTLNSTFGDELRKVGWDILVVDESHKFKNPTAKRTKRLMHIAHTTPVRMILTGSPVLNSPLDLFSQIRILDPKIFGANYYEFRARYFYDANDAFRSRSHWFPKWVIRPDALEKLSLIIAPHVARAQKKECLDLPPLVRSVVEVDMTPEQASHYQQMEQDFITFLEAA